MVQETTSAPGDWGGYANPTRSKVKRVGGHVGLRGRSRAARPSSRVDRRRLSATAAVDGWPRRGVRQRTPGQDPAYRPTHPQIASRSTPPSRRSERPGQGGIRGAAYPSQAIATQLTPAVTVTRRTVPKGCSTVPEDPSRDQRPAVRLSGLSRGRGRSGWPWRNPDRTSSASLHRHAVWSRSSGSRSPRWPAAGRRWPARTWRPSTPATRGP